MIFEKKTVPLNNETKEVEVTALWAVRWQSRYGPFNSDVKDEAEFFPNEQDALDFKKALENAFKLIKHTSGNNVSIKKIEH